MLKPSLGGHVLWKGVVSGWTHFHERPSAGSRCPAWSSAPTGSSGIRHTTAAKDKFIKGHFDRNKIADILEVFLNAGVDTIMGLGTRPLLQEGIQEAQQRTGRKLILISTPGMPWKPQTAPKAGTWTSWPSVLDGEQKNGATFCFPPRVHDRRAARQGHARDPPAARSCAR